MIMNLNPDLQSTRDTASEPNYRYHKKIITADLDNSTCSQQNTSLNTAEILKKALSVDQLFSERRFN